MLFALAAWVSDTLITFYVMVGRRPLSSDPGEASAQLSLRIEKFLISSLVEAFVVLLTSVIVLMVQWLYWRMRPAERPQGVAVKSLAVGFLYCGIRWGAWAIEDVVPLLEIAYVQLLIALLLAAAAGLFLGWARSNPG